MALSRRSHDRHDRAQQLSRRPLSLEVDLDVEIDGRPLRVRGRGSRIAVRLEGGRPSVSRRQLRQLAGELDRFGLTLEIQDRRGRGLARAGYGIDSRLGAAIVSSPLVRPRPLRLLREFLLGLAR